MINSTIFCMLQYDKEDIKKRGHDVREMLTVIN